MNMSNNIIILRSVYGKVNNFYYVQPCPNPKTGRHADCIRKVKGPVDNTEMILSADDIDQLNRGEKHLIPEDAVFALTDGTTFDLDDIVDAAKWEAIKHCNWIAKDRYEKDKDGNYVIDGDAKKYGVADLYVERPGEQAKVRITKKQKIHKACHYVYEDSMEDRHKKVRILGKNMRHAPDSDVTDFLISYAEKSPDKIIDLYEGEDWQLQLFIADAVEKGVIRKKDNIYKYDEFILGASVDATLLFLKERGNKHLYKSIKRETYPDLVDSSDEEEIKETNTVPSKKGTRSI